VGNPLQGVLHLTIVVAVLMLFIGALRIVFAFRMPSAGLNAALILSGGISVGLGAMTLTSFPFSAAVVLGDLLAVELISNGISLITLGLAARKQAL